MHVVLKCVEMSFGGRTLDSVPARCHTLMKTVTDSEAAGQGRGRAMRTGGEGDGGVGVITGSNTGQTPNLGLNAPSACTRPAGQHTPSQAYLLHLP